MNKKHANNYIENTDIIFFYQARGKQLKTQCTKESSSDILAQKLYDSSFMLSQFDKLTQLVSR
jgi:hypothetical protein